MTCENLAHAARFLSLLRLALFIQASAKRNLSRHGALVLPGAA
jgi:hypothetical protein